MAYRLPGGGGVDEAALSELPLGRGVVEGDLLALVGLGSGSGLVGSGQWVVGLWVVGGGSWVAGRG